MWIIYRLYRADQPSIIGYIGQTKRGLKTRLAEHYGEALKMEVLGRARAKDRWILEAYRAGVPIQIETICRARSELAALAAEQREIKRAVKSGHLLHNSQAIKQRRSQICVNGFSFGS